MAFFNLPFSVRIAGSEPIDGDRYLVADLSERNALIGSGREFNGLQVYVESEEKLYILVDKDLSIWVDILLSGTNGEASIISDDVQNLSNIPGDNITDALNNLNNSSNSINIRGTYNNTNQIIQVVPNPTFESGTGGWYTDDTLSTEEFTYNGNNQWTTTSAYLDKNLFTEGNLYTISFTSVNAHPPFVSFQFGDTISQNFTGAATSTFGPFEYVDNPSEDWGFAFSAGLSVTFENFTITENYIATFPTNPQNGNQEGIGSGTNGSIKEYDAWKALSDLIIGDDEFRIREGNLLVANIDNAESSNSTHWNILEWGFDLNRTIYNNNRLTLENGNFEVFAEGENTSTYLQLVNDPNVFTEPFYYTYTNVDKNAPNVDFFYQGNFFDNVSIGYTNNSSTSGLDGNMSLVIQDTLAKFENTVNYKGFSYESNSLNSVSWNIDDNVIPSIGLIKDIYGANAFTDEYKDQLDNLTGGNGITYSSDVISLGGSLTATVQLAGNTSYDFGLGTPSNRVRQFYSYSSNATILNSVSGSNDSLLNITPTSFDFHTSLNGDEVGIEFNTSDGLLIKNEEYNKGIKYDNSSTYSSIDWATDNDYIAPIGLIKSNLINTLDAGDGISFDNSTINVELTSPDSVIDYTQLIISGASDSNFDGTYTPYAGLTNTTGNISFIILNENDDYYYFVKSDDNTKGIIYEATIGAWYLFTDGSTDLTSVNFGDFISPTTTEQIQVGQGEQLIDRYQPSIAGIINYGGSVGIEPFLSFVDGKLRVDVLNEDDFNSNSGTNLATQSSIKNYVDTSISSIPSINGTNGLTNFSDNIGLGGELTQNTIIELNNYSLELSSTSGALVLTRINNITSSITTPVDGMIAYDSTINELQTRIDSTWRTVENYQKYRTTTTDATETELLNFSVGNNEIYPFHIEIYGIQVSGSSGTNGDTIYAKYSGVVKNIGGTTSFVGSFNENIISSDLGTASWNISLTANDTSNSLIVDVTGELNENINWIANLYIKKEVI
jgi:hypothetical protein